MSSYDPRAQLENALKSREQQRAELQGWIDGNATAMGNWSFVSACGRFRSFVHRTLAQKTDTWATFGRFAWEQTRDPEFLQSQIGPLMGSISDQHFAYYHNISGFFRGTWSGQESNTSAVSQGAISHPLASQLLSSNNETAQANDTLSPKNETEELFKRRGDFPWLSKAGGRMSLNIGGDILIPQEVSAIRGNLALQSNASGGESVEFKVDGLHFVRHGSIYLSAIPQESEEASDVRDVLSMVPQDTETRNLTATALQKALDKRVDQLKKYISAGPYDENIEVSATSRHNCSLHFYGRLSPAGPVELTSALETLEQELSAPTGISTIDAPRLELSSLIYSPDCDFLLDASHAAGLSTDRFWDKAVRYAAILALVYLIQARLLVQQMEVTRTPSALAKVSWETFAILSVLDGYVSLAHLNVAILSNNKATLPLIAAAFLSCILFVSQRRSISFFLCPSVQLLKYH